MVEAHNAMPARKRTKCIGALAMPPSDVDPDPAISQPLHQLAFLSINKIKNNLLRYLQCDVVSCVWAIPEAGGVVVFEELEEGLVFDGEPRGEAPAVMDSGKRKSKPS